MEDHKLYHALLKSQNEQRQLEQKKGEARPEENFRKERPFAGSERRSEKSSERTDPNWVKIGGDPGEHQPSVYDSSRSLELIGNPAPWSRNQLRAKKIIHPGMQDKEVMDAYRELRIQLRNRAGEGNFVVMFSSLGNWANSVLTAFNLAASFAMDSQTAALLVDCDPFNKDLANLVSVPMTSGVTDYVADKSLAVKDILYPSGVPRLSVIPGGTQASSAVELFSAERMRFLVSELKTRYPDRCIVLNAPPFQESTEARILERFADQIVLGVPFGEVTAQTVTDSVKALGSDKFSGLVFLE